jgi:hypothetical protein
LKVLPSALPLSLVFGSGSVQLESMCPSIGRQNGGAEFDHVGKESILFAEPLHWQVLQQGWMSQLKEGFRFEEKLCYPSTQEASPGDAI